ncbi:MAG: ABC transporter substrate-binding protein [Ignavibacteriales bacterium]
MKETATKIFLGLAFCALLLIVVIPAKQESPKNIVNYWFVAGANESIPPCVRLFNSSQDSIRVVCTPIPWTEHEKKVLTSILSENPPDVINLVTPVPKWAARKALVSLDQIIQKDRFDTTQFFTSLWKEMKYRGSTYALPAYTASFALYYNKKIFREAGLDPEKPPQTWNELKEYSHKILIRENGRITRMGFIPQYGNIETPLVIAFEQGVNLADDSATKVNLTDPSVIKAFQWEKDFFDIYSFNEVNAFMGSMGYGPQHGFISGKVAMIINDNSFIDQIAKYNSGLDYGVAMIPSFNGSESVSSAGSWWLAIPRGAKNKAAAWEFIKFVVSHDTQLKESMSREESLFPANRLAANDPAFLAINKHMKVFTRQMENTRSKSIVPLAHDIFWREFGSARERVIRGIQTPEKALNEAQRTIQSFLDRACDYDNYVNKKMKTERFFD